MVWRKLSGPKKMRGTRTWDKRTNRWGGDVDENLAGELLDAAEYESEQAGGRFGGGIGGIGGADVLVGTPGRLLEVVESSGVSLASVSTLVLDEADRLLAWLGTHKGTPLDDVVRS